jgi:hypothetical protein
MGMVFKSRSGGLRQACAGILMCACLGTSVAAERIALVVGNSRYANIPQLKNPSNDARAMENTLKDLGFRVSTVTDGDRR